jgi:hypothetical protein
MFADCPLLTYGHASPPPTTRSSTASAFPAALGVMLWIFARLSQTELVLPLVPIVAANIWHLGVFIGIVAILIGDSTGFMWLEFPRGSSVLLFAAFLLIAISAVATFGQRKERELISVALVFARRAALVSVDLFNGKSFARLRSSGSRRHAGRHRLVVRGQSDFRLARARRLGTAFYFLPKLAGRPLQSNYSRCSRSGLDDFRNVVRHPARRARAGVAAGIEFRRVRADNRSAHRHRHHFCQNRLRREHQLQRRAVLLHQIWDRRVSSVGADAHRVRLSAL